MTVRALALAIVAGSTLIACGLEQEGSAESRFGGAPQGRSAEEVPASQPKGAARSDSRRPAATDPEGPAPEQAPLLLTEARTLELRVDGPPHPVPDGAPHAVVHLPAGLRLERPLPLVVFLHGWSGCARVLALSGAVPCAEGGAAREGWELVERHAASRSDAVFIVPQLAWMQRSSSPGGFAEDGAFRAFLDQLLGKATAELQNSPRTIEDVDSITLLAHSAGWKTAEALIGSGGVDVDHVVLFDALYDDGRPFASWLLERSERRLVSVVAARGKPRHHTRLLLDLVRARGGEAAGFVPVDELGSALGTRRMVAVESPYPHGAIPRRHLTEVLLALGAGPGL